MANDPKLALATRLANLYSGVTQEKVDPVALLNNRDEYNRIVERALSLDNDELTSVALECADVEGFLCAVYWFSGRKLSTSQALSDNQWQALKNSAVNVAGPIGVFVVSQVKATGTATTWDSAISQIAKALGSGGERFKSDIARAVVVN